MNGETTPEFQERLKAHALLMDAAARANTIPLPGPLADAFSVAPEIKVGKYTVRPFYDADFEFLQTLNHPLHELMIESQAGGKIDSSKQKRSSVWELFYIFTHEINDVDALFCQGEEGIKTLKAEARKEFSRLQGPAVVALDAAIGRQMERYWSPCIKYDEAPDGEEANGSTNFTSAPASSPATASVG